MNYRKKYENALFVKLTAEHEVHHLDFNRKNNEISNLVCMSVKHHKKLHAIKNRYDKSICKIDELKYLFQKEKEDVLRDIKKWIDFKADILRHYIDIRDKQLNNLQ